MKRSDGSGQSVRTLDEPDPMGLLDSGDARVLDLQHVPRCEARQTPEEHDGARRIESLTCGETWQSVVRIDYSNLD